MTYNEFLLVLERFKTLPSFAQKIKYISETLTRIGSGSGRIVYDIDGTKVFKVAKNTKGIAQNEVEISVASYYDSNNIVADVIESDEENSTWIVAEKGKKVNERRICQLTGIPSLNDFYHYITNQIDANNGRKGRFSMNPELKEALQENEWVINMIDFIIGYGQSVGDLDRPSTYGEVLRDGGPIIVLVDYGLSDEVYATHYSRDRMHEIFNNSDGNDDILSNIGGIDAEIKGMASIQPFDVNDGENTINMEESISFIEGRNKYPKTEIRNIGELADKFHDCVNNLDHAIAKSKDKNIFYENLLKLEEYLTEQGHYNREPLPKVLNEKIDLNMTNNVASAVAQKYGFQQLQHLGGNGYGQAYDIGNNQVLKVTTDRSEALENADLIGKQFNYIADPYAVYEVVSKTTRTKLWVIILEKLRTDDEYFDKMFRRLTTAMKFIFNGTIYNSFSEVLNEMSYGYLNPYENENFKKYMANNKEDSAFFDNMAKIVEECNKFGIESHDYLNSRNLGFKPNGAIGFFDLGGSDLNTSDKDPELFRMKENAQSDEYPTYNQGDLGYDTENSILKEEFLGAIGTNQDGSSIDCYRNPPSIRQFKPFIRGLIDGRNGDLYVADATFFMHVSIAQWLKIEHIVDFPTHYRDYYDGSGRVLPVQRNKNTNDFYLGEIYHPEEIERDLLMIKRVFAMAKQKNPSQNFIPKNIEEAPKIPSINERIMSSMEGSTSVEVKDKCRLGGGATCNVGDMNNFNIKPIHEQIDASEAYDGVGTIQTVIDGKRNVGLIATFNKPNLLNMIKTGGLNTIPVEQAHHNAATYIIYNNNGKNDALKLHEYMKSKDGYVSDETPEEARYIGKLLGYTPNSVEQYVNRRYGQEQQNTPPQLQPNMQLDEDNINEYAGIVTPDLKLIKGENHNKILGKLFPEIDGYSDRYDHAYNNGYVRVIVHEGIVDGEPYNYYNIEGFLAPIKEVINRLYLRDMLKTRSDIYIDDIDTATSYTFKTPKENLQLNKFIGGINENNITFADSNENSNTVNETEMVNENEIMSLNDLPFKQEIEGLGAKIYSVGGAVRDEFLGKESKDLDILITGIPMDNLEQLLSKYGRVDAVGKSFGVIKFKPKGSTEDIDIAIPRTEVPTGAGGHKGFDVKSDHTLPIEDDLKRRDLTINAIAKDSEGNIIDPFGGVEDLKNKIIRAVDPNAFNDDPLRMLRAVQFSARFGFTIEPNTMEMIKQTADKVKTISPERVIIEFEKIVKYNK